MGRAKVGHTVKRRDCRKMAEPDRTAVNECCQVLQNPDIVSVSK